MAKALKNLREKIARFETRQTSERNFSLGHETADAALERGLLPGALHEVYAAERHAAAGTGFALMLALRLAGEKTILWARQDFSAVPCGELSAMGFLDPGLDPHRLILVRAATAMGALRAAADSLSCKALGSILLDLWGQAKVLDLVASRRLTLSAAHSCGRIPAPATSPWRAGSSPQCSDTAEVTGFPLM